MSIQKQFHTGYATLTLNEPITQALAWEFRHSARAMREYWKYDHLVVEINSPGGELLALKAIQAEMVQWRKSRGTLATCAAMTAGSAAALLLAFGDVGKRTVQPYSQLLFHHTRVMTQSEQMMTADAAQHTAHRLHQADDMLVYALAVHVSSAYGASVEKFGQAGLLRCNNLRHMAKDIAIALGADASMTGTSRSEPKWLKDLDKAYERVVQKKSLAPYTDLLKKIFQLDARMPTEMAWAALLIDCVEGVADLQPKVVASRQPVAALEALPMAA